MFFGFGFGGVREWAKDGLAFVPVGKLVGVVFTAGLAGLSGSNQHDGIIPVCKIGHEALGRAMGPAGSARAPNGACLRAPGNAEQFFQSAVVADGVEHFQIVEMAPGPIRGIGFAKYKNLSVYIAVIAEVEVDSSSGVIKVPRVFAAADAGQIINPIG